MCMQDTELDKILRRLEERTTEIETRLYSLEEAHNETSPWSRNAPTLEQVVGHPIFLRKIERLRQRLSDLENRLTKLEDLHPEVLVGQLEAARHG